jgi:hypothetical protein
MKKILICLSLLLLLPTGYAASITDDNGGLLQWVINALFTVVGLLGGWVLNTIQKSLKELQIADGVLADKVHLIDVLVAGQYVRKDELEKLSIALFSKLDRIELKIDNKADK